MMQNELPPTNAHLPAQTATLVVALLSVMLGMLACLPAIAGEDEDRLAKVYAGRGTTLYCRSEITARKRFKIDFIYTEKQLLNHYKCLTSRQCQRKSDFARAAGDLHNMYPIERAVALDRRGAIFEASANVGKPSRCGYFLSYRNFEPPEHARGNVARALVYMHKRHNLPLQLAANILQDWNKIDPPDDEEIRRNNAIQRLQGNGNEYIINPKLLDNVVQRGR